MTAKQFYRKKAKELDSDPKDMAEWMIEAAIEFAKYHVNEFAKELDHKLVQKTYMEKIK